AGGHRFVRVVCTPWIEGGEVAGWVASVSDITDLKRTTIELQEREQRLRLALDASGAGCWMRDALTGRVVWDDRFRKLYGFTAEEPASFEAWLSRVHAEDREQGLELVDTLQHPKTEDPFDTTFGIVRPDQTMWWIQSLGQANRDAEGRIIRFPGLELISLSDAAPRRLSRCAASKK